MIKKNQMKMYKLPNNQLIKNNFNSVNKWNCKNNNKKMTLINIFFTNKNWDKWKNIYLWWMIPCINYNYYKRKNKNSSKDKINPSFKLNNINKNYKIWSIPKYPIYIDQQNYVAITIQIRIISPWSRQIY